MKDCLTITNKEILEIAMKQSAIDSGCSANYFCSYSNKVVISKNNPDARTYLKLPFLCDSTQEDMNLAGWVGRIDVSTGTGG